MAEGNCSGVTEQFRFENEEALTEIVRRLRVVARAMGGIAASHDPERARKDAKAALFMAEDLVDELSQLVGIDG